MKTAIAQDQEPFRPINLEFLVSRSSEHFDIFYQTRTFGTVRYVKFASTDPRHQEKIQEILEKGDSEQEYFVREEDLIKYYQHVTQSLKSLISNPKVPLKQKTQKIYNVSQEIMQEFFEYNASQKVLQSSEEVMDIMEQCLSNSSTGYYGLSMITNKDYYTYTHSVNVGLYCLVYGIKTNMPQNDIKDLGLGGMLHDVGKAQIDSLIINKKGKLTDEEFETMKSHAALGEGLLASMQCYRSNVVKMAGDHHEQYNGKGYPKGLVGEQISLYGRICKVMDVYDALTTRRSYKKSMSPFDTLTIMNKQMADEFDPEILQNFIRFMGPEL